MRYTNPHVLMRLRAVFLAGLLAATVPATGASGGETPARLLLEKAAVAEDVTVQIECVKQLADAADDELIARALAGWRLAEFFIHTEPDGARVPFVLDSQTDGEGKARGVRVRDGEFIQDAAGAPIWFVPAEQTPVDTTSSLRRAIKTTLDLFAMANPDPAMRRDAITRLGQEQNPEYVPHFEKRLETEAHRDVKKALAEAIALTQLADADPAVRNGAIRTLAEMRSVNALSFLKDFELKVQADPARYGDETAKLLRTAIAQIENYIWWGTQVGTAFRGLSLAAVLLVAALGLAITFGLMGVINMAHGEMMAVGAYTAYVVQELFGGGLMFSLFGRQVSFGGFGWSGGALDSYFLAALAASFVTAGAVGLALERGVIRFLYKRPLESLLATWGVSLVMQQLFRHTFGAANVQVNSPAWLRGSYVINDVSFAYNRLFVIGFAVFIVVGTWLLLTRTSVGLQIRAVMQNRAMASCMGVRTDRVNMLTFAFGSGLAGMAGACLSQITNVGPGLGQSYIVDCFMIVVLGGVGNLVGTVFASFGVGVTDQVLQPWLGAVMGKITVLAAIILFLQWRPAGLFVTRSRSLDG